MWVQEEKEEEESPGYPIKLLIGYRPKINIGSASIVS